VEISTEGDQRVAVMLYTMPGCTYCAAARADLEARGVEFEEIDILTVPGALERVAELTGGQVSVPVLVDGDEVRVGFGGGCAI
jgi:glutaredoxin 3